MKLPEPELGLVFRYDYVWSREAQRGKSTSKERPACIALATDSEIVPQLVVILPITHRKPTDGTSGIEGSSGSDARAILRAVKRCPGEGVRRGAAVNRHKDVVHVVSGSTCIPMTQKEMI